VIARLAALAALAALALLGGCGGSQAPITAGGRVAGQAVTVYSSLPNPGSGAARDIVDGEKLAVLEADGQAGGLDVNFVSVDESGGEAAAAEQVIRDPQVIAVIGALRSSTAMTSIPLFNAAGILLVSPGASYEGFTEPIAPGEPDRWYPSGRRTFARLVEDDGEQARALLDAADGRRVAVERAPGRVGAALAEALERADAADDSVRIVAARADSVVIASEDPEHALAAAARAAPDATLVFPDALTRAGVEPDRRAVFVTSAPEPGSTPELRAFEAAFRERYGRAPGPYAAVGYEGMRGVLAAIDRAAPRSGVRARVNEAFFAQPPRPLAYRRVSPASR
jgi:branched-chain amino acid transport system substrate-binding protein